MHVTGRPSHITTGKLLNKKKDEASYRDQAVPYYEGNWQWLLLEMKTEKDDYASECSQPKNPQRDLG